MTDEDNKPTSMSERLHGLLQRALPHRLLTALMYWSTRLQFRPWKNWQIRWFIGRYGVDICEAVQADPESYPHFNAFFTRSLRPGSRPVQGGDETIACPADGKISAIGDVHAGMMLQAKGRDYSLHGLLGGDDDRSKPFEGGRFATLYLSPRDYHRVHMPTDGRLREMTYIPGRLFSVNFATARVIPGLFTKNERLVCIFDTDLGPMALILVGAMLVSGMETIWSGMVAPPHGQPMFTRNYQADDAVQLSRGAEMGRFNTGSTVILILPRDKLRWSDDLQIGSGVQMGQRLGVRVDW